jgi:HEAT repeat protein
MRRAQTISFRRSAASVCFSVILGCLSGCNHSVQTEVERLLQEPDKWGPVSARSGRCSPEISQSEAGAFLDEAQVEWLIQATSAARSARSEDEIVEDLVQLGKPAVPVLMQWLQRGDRASVRAATALGKIGDARAADALAETMPHASQLPETFKELPESQAKMLLRHESALALCRLNDPRGIRTVIEGMSWAIAQGRGSRRMGIWAHSLPNTTLFMLVEGRVDADEGWDVIAGMDGTAIPALLECAGEEAGADDPFIAIRLLGAIGHSEAAQPLLKMIETSEVQKRAALIHALGLIGDSRAVEPVAALWTKTAPWGIKCAAAEALPRLGPSAVPVAIDRIRQDPEEGIRQLGLRELARTNDPRVIDELLWLIDSDRARDSVYAARALIHTNGGPKVIEGLKRALTHTNFGVRNDAAKALAKLAGTEAVQPLIALVRDRDPMVRETAAGELGKLRAVEAIPELSALTNDQSWGVRYSAVTALGSIRSKDGLAAIRARLDDPQPQVRDAAMKALRAISPESTSEPDSSP